MKPINFKKWIDENRNKLKPPVGNIQVWPDREFWVTVVGGPNARSDFHINQGEEFFYQIEGNINLKLWQDGRPVDFKISEGEIFLLPPGIPHSPQRPAGTVGLVIEHKRTPEQLDSLVWFCESCHKKLYQETFHLENIVTQFGPVFERYFSNPDNHTCKNCGWKAEKK